MRRLKVKNTVIRESWLHHEYTQDCIPQAKKDLAEDFLHLVSAAETSTDPKLVKAWARYTQSKNHYDFLTKKVNQ